MEIWKKKLNNNKNYCIVYNVINTIEKYLTILITSSAPDKMQNDFQSNLKLKYDILLYVVIIRYNSMQIFVWLVFSVFSYTKWTLGRRRYLCVMTQQLFHYFLFSVFQMVGYYPKLISKKNGNCRFFYLIDQIWVKSIF